MKIAKVAKIELKDNELDSVSKDLSSILSMINKLQEIDTENVEPLYHVHDSFITTRIVNEYKHSDSQDLFQNVEGERHDMVKKFRYFLLKKKRLARCSEIMSTRSKICQLKRSNVPGLIVFVRSAVESLH